ncbi:hypothetical protein Ancab_025478 [Ancistrocladus abbreviatus]
MSMRGRSSLPFSYRRASSPFSSSSSTSSFMNTSGRFVPRSCSTYGLSFYGSANGYEARSMTPNRNQSDSMYAATRGYEGLSGEPLDVPRLSGDSISVTVQFRSMNDCEYQRGNQITWYSDGDKIVHSEYNPATTYAFVTDKVFGPNATSEEVYEVAARPVVKAAMEGVNGTVFAYGVTSSGKTHTMHTPGREFLLRVSYLEIYNEDHGMRSFEKLEGGLNQEVGQTSGLMHIGKEIRMLHLPFVQSSCGVMTPDSGEHRFFVRIGTKKPELDISSQNCQVSAITGTKSMLKAMLDFFTRGLIPKKNYWPVPRTDLCRSIKNAVDWGNTHPSEVEVVGREGQHFMDSLSMGHFYDYMYHLITEYSKLLDFKHGNLIDLAGSESSKTETTGLRRKEGLYINKSLLTLGTVIGKLSEGKASHIPYRDSKLTYLLQSFLSGRGHVLLICTVIPASSSTEETHNTLKFASRSKRVEIYASRNKIVDEKSLIKKYQREISSLKQELGQLRRGMLAGISHEEIMSLRQQLEEGQVKMQSRLEEEEEAKAALMSRIQRLTKLILVSTKNAIPGYLGEVSGHQ